MEHRSKDLFDNTMPRNGTSRKEFRGRSRTALVLVALVGLAIAGVTTVVGPLAPRRVTAHSPTVAAVKRLAEVQRTLPLQGTLELPDQGVLTAPESGTIREVRVRTGEVVRRGQELMVVEARPLQEELRLLKPQLAGLEERLGLIDEERRLQEVKASQAEALRVRDLERKAALAAEQTDLAARGLVSARDLADQAWTLDQARAAATLARTDEALARIGSQEARNQVVRERDAARERVSNLEGRLAACVVRSPADLLVLGTGQDQVRTGSPVVQNQGLLSYALVSRAEVRFAVPGYAASALTVGAPLDVTINDKVYGARITLKGQLSTDRSSETTVAALLETLPDPLISGQGVQTTLRLEKRPQSLTLPTGPWVGSGRLEWVYKVSADGKRAVKTKVRLSTDYDQVIVVLGGLEENDRIITDAYEEFGGAETIAIEGDSHVGA